jgi:major vault protein
VILGPNLVKLEPDEQFTVVYLSGGKPKKPGVIKTLHIGLGPDFFSDIFQVETSDHARLKLQLSYNWEFVFERDNRDSAIRIFNVKDFVGDACSAIASKVRGEVASLTFETFHKLSARHIRKAIFGLDKDGKVQDRIIFANNSLHVTNVDIQIVEPVDEKTKQSLQKLVTLAIEITTKMQEAEAKKQADKNEQEAKAALKKRQIEDEALAEKERRDLYNLQAECESIKTSGKSKAEARAQAQ